MRSTGIVRKIDPLGRLVIPKEIRRQFNIEEEDPMEIFVDGKYILIAKFQNSCMSCGEVEDNIVRNNMRFCKKCIKEMAAMVK